MLWRQSAQVILSSISSYPVWPALMRGKNAQTDPLKTVEIDQ